jgi:hypothetical protein
MGLGPGFSPLFLWDFPKLHVELTVILKSLGIIYSQRFTEIFTFDWEPVSWILVWLGRKTSPSGESTVIEWCHPPVSSFSRSTVIEWRFQLSLIVSWRTVHLQILVFVLPLGSKPYCFHQCSSDSSNKTKSRLWGRCWKWTRRQTQGPHSYVPQELPSRHRCQCEEAAEEFPGIYNCVYYNG